MTDKNPALDKESIEAALLWLKTFHKNGIADKEIETCEQALIRADRTPEIVTVEEFNQWVFNVLGRHDGYDLAVQIMGECPNGIIIKEDGDEPCKSKP